MTTAQLAFGPFVLDVGRGALLREGQPVALGHKGLLLLQTLLQAPGQIQSKAALMEAAWGQAIVEESNLSVQIAALRKLLGPQADGSAWIITVPRGGYRFAGDVRALGETAGPFTSAADAPERPSIIVLPFANVSGASDQDYLADAITEDIITTLTRFRWFRVIGRNTSFVYKGRPVASKEIAHELGVRYVLDGSVRRAGQQLRISAQLVDAASEIQIWGERYEMAIQDAFAVQDAIAERLAAAIEPELLLTNALPASPRQSGNVTAWDLVRQGTWHFHHVTRDTHLKARAQFREASRLDPELAEAWLWLGRVSAGLVAYRWTESPERDIREGLEAALKAIQLDRRSPYSHYALAICSAYANAPEQAILAAEAAIEISNSFALGHLVLGMGQLFRGCPDEAIAALERGLALNPHDPQNFVWYNLLALAHLFAGHAETALAAATKGRKVRPAWRPIQQTIACCHAALGDLRAARSAVAQMTELDAPAGDALEPLRQRNPHWKDMLARLLAAAGCRDQ
jgi:TolB-like protein